MTIMTMRMKITTNKKKKKKEDEEEEEVGWLLNIPATW